ncbi:MAG: preprotein translocase subunit SecG [Gammaproteobacteria bacterium]|nr:preprotein translocase subunit SecG [Gammaproteobacteria bacterium]MCW8909097.1 preprotein translocase subunit SecG [Gammaproteobacteria bacterium]MCW9004788.1 preprotein translocase subunit SecG [Gammaproteobacteria bacterium]
METILLVVHVMLSLAIIGLVLLQRGKGAEAGAALGGGGGGASGSVFGSQGSANFLSRSTAILATAFFVTSLALAYMASNRVAPSSVTEAVESVVTEQKASTVDDVPAMDVPAEQSDIPVMEVPAEKSDVPVPAAEK